MIWPAAPAERPGISLASTTAISVLLASSILTMCGAASSVYSPAGNVFPKTTKLKGTFARASNSWAGAGNADSPTNKQRVAKIRVCFFTKVLPFPDLIDLAMREPLEQIDELLYRVLRDMNTQVTGFWRRRHHCPLDLPLNK